jgi:hypothetical protein
MRWGGPAASPPASHCHQEEEEEEGKEEGGGEGGLGREGGGKARRKEGSRSWPRPPVFSGVLTTSSLHPQMASTACSCQQQLSHDPRQ